MTERTLRGDLRRLSATAPTSALRYALGAWFGAAAAAAAMLLLGWLGFHQASFATMFFVLPVVLLVCACVAVIGFTLGVITIVRHRTVSSDRRRGGLAIAISLPFAIVIFLPFAWGLVE